MRRTRAASPPEGSLSQAAAATLAEVKRQFTGREPAVERAFAASETFRGLCEDYVACVAALERWQDSRAEGARARVQEYSELLGELTKEMEASFDTGER